MNDPKYKAGDFIKWKFSLDSWVIDQILEVDFKHKQYRSVCVESNCNESPSGTVGSLHNFAFETTEIDQCYLATEYKAVKDFNNDLKEILMSDNVNSPKHYQGVKFQVIDAIEEFDLNFNLGNCLKYIARAGKKNPDKHLEDLSKALWYLNREIDNLKSKNNK